MSSSGRPEQRGMSDPEDILRKTDALLGRYRAAQRNPELDEDVPLLTDVVEMPDASDAPVTGSEPATPSTTLLAGIAIDDQSGLERLVVARVSEAVTKMIEQKLAGIAEELRTDLTEMVERAVSDALEDARSPDRKQTL